MIRHGSLRHQGVDFKRDMQGATPAASKREREREFYQMNELYKMVLRVFPN